MVTIDPAGLAAGARRSARGGLTEGEFRFLQRVDEEIAAGGLVPGSRLPTEREWVQKSGQSRSVVRRALALLEAEGKVVRHVGRGTFLATDASVNEAEPATADGSSPAEIMATRLVIEPPTMPLIASAARAEDFAEMERCLQGGERNREYEEFERWDAAFHRSLALATHNQLLVRVCDMTNDARHGPLWGQLKRRSFTGERCEQYIRDHRNIGAALLDRDGVAAQKAMRQHLLRVRANLLGEGV